MKSTKQNANAINQSGSKKIRLVVEKAGNEFWGRMTVNRNLIVDSADSLSELIKRMKLLVFDFEKIEIREFEVVYDLAAFFNLHSVLNISDLAARAGINSSLMRQYAIGAKYPSEERVRQIESAIRAVGMELSKISLHRSNKRITESSPAADLANGEKKMSRRKRAA